MHDVSVLFYRFPGRASGESYAVELIMQAEPGVPQQLWLDVERPIQTRPPRERAARGRPARGDTALPSPQMELRIVALPAAPIVPVAPAIPFAPKAPPRTGGAEDAAAAPALSPIGAAPGHGAAEAARPCFVVWLREQGKQGGAIGELAKAARIDPLFPRNGSADEVRSRFNSAGADGDAFAALDDAERAYDRAA